MLFRSVPLDDGYWRVLVLQERLPGSPPKVANAAVIEAMLAMSEHFTDALADRPDVPRRPLWLQRGSPDYPRHDLLAGYDARTRRMLDRLDEYLTRVLDPTLMRRYWAHCTLHRLHWTLTFNDAEAIDMGLRLGNVYLR